MVWTEFDTTTASSPLTSPWAERDVYVPDYDLLERLLEIPLRHGSVHRTGLPAKAVDVWIAHELRRSGFGEDEVWPRRSVPRVLPREAALLVDGLPSKLRTEVAERLRENKIPRVGSVDARVLGKAYEKQVDVVVSQWARGPEVLISTKRMSSSLSNNAFNRIEESYGDAHNLRGRYPLAAIGYVLLVRSTALQRAPVPAERLLDLVKKLGNDEQGYDATAVVVASWHGDDDNIDEGSKVKIEQSAVPEELGIDKFLSGIIHAVLERTPVDMHVAARELKTHRNLPLAES